MLQLIYRHNLFLLFIHIFTISISAQVRNGSVEYGLIFAEDKELENSVMATYFAEAKKNAKYITFTLNFNKDEMCFFKNSILNIDGVDTTFSTVFSGVNGKTYRNRNSDIILNEQYNNNLGNIIVTNELKTNWTLTKETKLIDNYLCYKATMTIDIVNSVGTFKRQIVAWYCPKIPVPFGPKGYGGLPGLILELQEKGAVIGAKKISLNLKEIVIAKPIQGKFLTQKELNDKIEKK